MYFDFEAGNKAYKLKLTTRGIMNLESKIGCNPLMIFGRGDRIPTVTEMVHILHNSLTQYNHGITLNDAAEIFATWLDEGHQVADFVSVIIEIYKVSGIMSSNTETEEDGEEDEKN